MRTSILVLATLLVAGLSQRAFAAFDIYLLIEDSPKIVAKTTTDASGKWTVDHVPPGVYIVKVVDGSKSYVCKSTKSQAIQVVAPRDAASGLATGKRMHKPIVITKEWDKSSPVLSMTIDGTTISGTVTSPSKHQ